MRRRRSRGRFRRSFRRGRGRSHRARRGGRGLLRIGYRM